MPENSRAKARALRIPLRSHALDRLAKFRTWLTIAAILVCLLWLWTGHVRQSSVANRYSPGPVSAVHAHLGCDSCHGKFAPVRDSTFTFFAKRTTTGGDSLLWHRESDVMCQACHPLTDGKKLPKEIMRDFPPLQIAQPIPVASHSANQDIETVGSCAGCHVEHRGAETVLSRVGDSTCTDCHREIEGFRLDNDSLVANSVTGFDKIHPDFVSLKADAGTLKFNHSLHMTAGLIREGDNEKLIKTIASYPDQDGRLVGLATTGGQIELECGFCHQPSDQPGMILQTFVAARQSHSDSGKFMSMPNYEQHCQVCHSIDVVPRSELDFEKPLRIEHGASPTKITDALQVYFALEAIAPPEIKQQISNQGIGMPLEVPTRLWNVKDPETNVGKDVRDYFDQAEMQIRTNCLKCHLESAAKNGTGIPDIQLMAQNDNSHTVGQVYNTRWLRKGRFDHEAHRDVACASCHVLSAGKSELIRQDIDLALDRPMIKDRESCVECHQSPVGVVPPLRPGPTTCVSCHTYHGGGNRQ